MRLLRTLGMLCSVFMAVASVVANIGPSFPPADATAQAEPVYRPGRVLVKLKDEFAARPQQEREAIMRGVESQTGIINRRTFSHLPRQHVLEFDEAQSVDAMVQRLRASGLYEFVEPDRILHAMAVPNETTYANGTLWSLHNTGASGGIAGADINAAAGWDVRWDASKVIVAMVDSGLRMTHEDIVANLWANPSPATSGTYANDLHGINAVGRSGNPNDDNGHGTHVSGIIGAVGNNGIGITGVAWQVKLMPLKFLDSIGSGSTSDSITCINYAIQHGAKVINASYGSTIYSQSELAAIKSARDAGIIFVTAAGNDGANSDTVTNYPANYPLDNIVSVAASNNRDQLSSFSDYGSGSVELAAPGEEIYSTYNSSDSSYATLSGTSMATPHVTGAIALLRAQYPTDTYRQIINRLLRGVDHSSAFAGKVQTGGRLNLARALAPTTLNTPFNDNFADRAQLTGSIIQVRSSNGGATSEAGEPAHAGVSAKASLWWTWTAPNSGSAFFDTVGSDHDTTVAIYTGNTLGSLQPIAANDDASAGVVTSRATATVSAGTTYQIAVDGKNGATGLTLMQIGLVPANDNFANAQVVTGLSFAVSDNNVNASREPGEPNHAGNASGHSLWYKWVAPATGQFQLAAFSSVADMVAAVYTGTSVSTLQLVAQNDNSSAFNSDALVTFNATQNTTYYFAVDSAPGSTGPFTLSLVDSLWQFPTLGQTDMSSPAVGPDGTVYFGSTDDSVYAINPDGTKKWQYVTSDMIELASPAIGSDGTVYIGGDTGYLYAFSASGARKWRTLTNGPIGSTPAIGSDGTIYIRSADFNLYAIRADGSVKWTMNLGETSTTGASYASPAIGSDGTIYLGSADNNFYAIRDGATAGSIKWKFSSSGQIYSSAALGSDGTIYFGNLNGDFYAVNPDGTQKWKHSFGTAFGITSSPAVGADGAVYFGAYDNKIHALNADGTVKWEYLTGGDIRASSPAIAADGTLYIGCYDNNVYAMNPDGTLKRTYSTAGILRSSPVIAGGRVYVCSEDSKLYALSLGESAAGTSWPMCHQNSLHTGSIGSAPVALAKGDSNSRLINISTRGMAGNDAQALIGGFVITGGPRTVLVRAAGPALKSFGVSGTVAAPRLQIYNVGSSNTLLFDTNGNGWDNASNASDIAAASVAVGAFAFNPKSGDAALLVTLPPGSYTANISPASGVPGVALMEVYDDGPVSSTARLSNLSSRLQGGASGSQTATAGFAIRGGAKNVIIRGIGPMLASFNLTGTLAKPGLRLYKADGTLVASNDAWGSGNNTAQITSVDTSVGAFALTAGSSDTALLLTLPEGGYTAQVVSPDGSTGIILIEVYDVGT